MKPHQLALFLPSPVLPSRPFVRWSRSFDEVRICAKCGREIIAQRRTASGEVLSEFQSAAGKCWSCERDD